MDKDARQRNRRRARAQFMKAKGANSATNGDETGDDEAIHKPPRPPNRRRKLREPLFEEDIIDGFAIASFKTYQDLERAVHHAEKLGLKCLEAVPAVSGVSTMSRKRKRRPTNEESSGEAYFCDHSASDEDKVSESGSGVFATSLKSNTDVSRIAPPANANGLANSHPPLISSHTPLISSHTPLISSHTPLISSHPPLISHTPDSTNQRLHPTVAPSMHGLPSLSSVPSAAVSTSTAAVLPVMVAPSSVAALSVTSVSSSVTSTPLSALSAASTVFSTDLQSLVSPDSRGFLPHPGLVSFSSTPASSTAVAASCLPRHPASSPHSLPHSSPQSSAIPLHSSRVKFGILDLVSSTSSGSSGNSRLSSLPTSTTAPASLSSAPPSSLAPTSAYVPFSHHHRLPANNSGAKSLSQPPLLLTSSTTSAAAAVSLVNGQSSSSGASAAVNTAAAAVYPPHPYRHYHSHQSQQYQQVNRLDSGVDGGKLAPVVPSTLPSVPALALTTTGSANLRPVNLAIASASHPTNISHKQQQQSIVSAHSHSQQQRHPFHHSHHQQQHFSHQHQYHPHLTNHLHQHQQIHSKTVSGSSETITPSSGAINNQSAHHQASAHSQQHRQQQQGAALMFPQSTNRLSLPSSSTAGQFPPPPAHNYYPHQHLLHQQRMGAAPVGGAAGQSSLPGTAPAPRPAQNMMMRSPWIMDKTDRFNSHQSAANRSLPCSRAMSPAAPPVQLPAAITTYSQPVHLPAPHSSAHPLPMPGSASGLPPTSSSTASAQHFNNMLHCAGKSADVLRRELDSRFLATLDRSAVPGSTGVVPGASAVVSTPANPGSSAVTPAGSNSVLDLHQRSSAQSSNQLRCVKPVSSAYLNPRQQQTIPAVSSLAASTALSPAAAPAGLNFGLPAAPLSLHHTKKTGRWNAMHVRIAWEIHRQQQQQQNRQQRRSASRSSTPSIAGAPKAARLTPVTPVKSPAAPAIRMPDPTSIGTASMPLGFPSASPVLSALSASSSSTPSAASFGVSPHGGAAGAPGGFRFPGLSPATALPPTPLEAWNRFPHPSAGSVGVPVSNSPSGASWPGAVDVCRRASPLLSQQQQKQSHSVQPSITAASNNSSTGGAPGTGLKSGSTPASVLPPLAVGTVPRAPLAPYNGLLAAAAAGAGGAPPPLDPFLAPLIYHRHHDPLAAALEHQRHLLTTASIYGSAAAAAAAAVGAKPLIYPPVAPLPSAHHLHPSQTTPQHPAAMFGLALGGAGSAVPAAAAASMAPHAVHVPRRADTHQPLQAPPR